MVHMITLIRSMNISVDQSKSLTKFEMLKQIESNILE